MIIKAIVNYIDMIQITKNLVSKSQEKKFDYIKRKYMIKADLFIFYLNEFYDCIKPYNDSNEELKSIINF